MSEQSFPIEEQPLPGAQWSAVTRGIGNGILDQGGFPYRLVFESDANATNQGILKCPTLEGKKYGQAILDGFYHKYDKDLVLDFPAVTKSTLYYVVLEIVPTRATEGQPPVQAKVVTSLDTTQDKNYLHLYNVRRQPNQLLTDAEVRMIRPRVAPVQVYAYEQDMPQAQKSLWGTLAVVHGGRANESAKIFMAMNSNSSGNDDEDEWAWKLIYDQDANGTYTWESRADTGYVHAGHGFVRAIGRRGKKRAFRGRVARENGVTFNPGNPYSIWSGTLRPEDRPAESQRFVVAAGNLSVTPATVEVSKTGEVTAWVSDATYWMGLDGIEWEVP